MSDIFSRYCEYIAMNKSKRLTRGVIFDLPYCILRTTYEREYLRENGVFFTGRKLAQKLIDRVGTIDRRWKVYDPAAGAGDLLVNYADRLPVESTVEKTVATWGEIFFATELEKSFVPLIKLRLLLLAYLKVHSSMLLRDVELTLVTNCFKHVIHGNFLDSEILADLILVNPPFNGVVIHDRFSWGAGRMSNAAYFIYTLEKLYPNSTIAAILPDVIRSGSRYNKLRQVLPRFSLEKETPVGRFDKFTDVDVFIAVARKLYKQGSQHRRRSRNICIGDLFDVHVGSVVPHREPIAGDENYYLTAKNVETGKEMRCFSEKIRSFHKPIKGPFIIAKRTSSPSDRVRCSASLIATRESFHLENHLIFIKAKEDIDMNRYREITRFLNSQECSCFLNRAIRCRHLTVSTVKQIPIKD